MSVLGKTMWCENSSRPDSKAIPAFQEEKTSQTNLRKDLEELIEVYAKGSKKLLTTGDSQANEALNSVAWSKAPKCRNYTVSESFNYRMASAVCQFNDGPGYGACRTDTSKDNRKSQHEGR